MKAPTFGLSTMPVPVLNGRLASAIEVAMLALLYKEGK